MSYTVYKFPSLFGTPKLFQFWVTSRMYATFLVIFTSYTVEIENNASGQYLAYWPLGLRRTIGRN